MNGFQYIKIKSISRWLDDVSSKNTSLRLRTAENSNTLKIHKRPEASEHSNVRAICIYIWPGKSAWDEIEHGLDPGGETSH